MNPYQQALNHYEAGQNGQAAQILQNIVRNHPQYAPAWHLMSVIAHKNGHLEKAVEFINQAAGADSHSGEIQAHRAELLRLAGDLETALEAGHAAVDLAPENATGYNNLGLVWQDLKKLEEAKAAFQQAITLKPNYARAYYNLATILHEAREDESTQEEAAALLRKALTINPNYMRAHLLMGMVLTAQYQHQAAALHFRRAYELSPSNPKYFLNYANALSSQRRYKEAVEHFHQALALQPDYPEAFFGLGTIADQKKHREKSHEFYQKAIESRPDWPEAWHSLGGTLNEMDRHAEAKEAFLKALELKPDAPEIIASLLRVLSSTCDWPDIDRYFQTLYTAVQDAIAAGKRPPMSGSQSNAYGFTNEEKLILARFNTAEIKKKMHGRYPDVTFTYPEPEASPKRLRIGYLSYDFRNHATSHLMRTVFQHHDRDRFEIFTYSYGPDDDSRYREKIIADSEHFIEMRDMTELESAQRIHDDQIHILVDLMGYVANCKPEIAALRPAPVQINYLGFPGTMGSDTWDYIITDKNTTPPEDAQFFGENLAYVPNIYQCTDHRQPIDPTPVTRADEGLPEDAIVFVSFNTLYKIESTRFAAWMRILDQVPNSVLWLLAKHDYVRANLRREATNHGIDPDRLIFGEGKHKPLHLARFQLADLFLDTRYYNAHTTASDSLWAGVPVLTCPGPTFSAKVAASILRAIELPELIMPDMASYEREAVRLGNDPAALAALKAKLKEKVQTTPLFDTGRWTRNVENLYDAIWARHVAGEPPAMIEAADSGPSGIAIGPDSAL